METIGGIIKSQITRVPESAASHSDTIVNGKNVELSQEEIDRFWKVEFIKSMEEVSPDFVVDERNKALISAIYDWCWRKKCSVLDINKGLLLWGDIGVGKSVLLRGLRIYEGKINRYLCGSGNKSLGFDFMSAAEISLIYAEKGMEGISKFTDREKMGNLAIDEVGREPTDSKHFGTSINVIQVILQLRYEVKNKFFTHLTTNMNPDTDFSLHYGAYIADRVKEMFNVVEVKGKTRR